MNGQKQSGTLTPKEEGKKGQKVKATGWANKMGNEKGFHGKKP